MTRKLKIYEQSMGGGNYTQVPTILLKGKWLVETASDFYQKWDKYPISK